MRYGIAKPQRMKNCNLIERSEAVVLFRRDKAFNASQQFFFRHTVESHHIFLASLSNAFGNFFRCIGNLGRSGFRLIHFNMLLQRMDQVFLQIIRREGLIGNLAQGNNRILVVVAVNRDRCTLGNLAGTVTSQQNQFKTVLDLVYAVLNGNAGHTRSLSFLKI